jgi:general stress protein 26
MATRDDDVRKLWEMIKDIDFTMFTTACADGTLRGRPMSTQKKVEFDGDLWFFSERGTGKTFEIRNDQHVCLGYADPSHNRYVSVSGVATLVDDRAKAKELWTPGLKAWFPDGPESPEVQLIKVHVTEAEYWDAPSNKVVRLVGFVKAIATGQKYEPGENKKLSIDPAAQPGEHRAADPSGGSLKVHGDKLAQGSQGGT